ncbi:MAG: FGLLP motif-containing membrane protein [Candidatus Limnocylindrales bacterium]
MVRRVVRRNGRVFARIVATLAVAALALAMPAAVAADVAGGCTLTGTSTSGGPIDLTSTPTWHILKGDSISGTATAPTTQWHAAVAASLLGLGIPIASGQSEGATHAASDSYDIAAIAALGRVFVISGSSTGPHGGCSGQVQVVIDDVNPLLTVMGGGGLAGVVLGLLGLAWASRRPSSAPRMVMALSSGTLIGAGSALVLQQVFAGGSPGSFGSSAFADAVIAPAQLSLDPAVLIQSALVTLIVVVLLPFPAELFNRTLEENLDRIRAGLRRLPFSGRMVGAASAPGAPEPASSGPLRLIGATAFVLVAGLLYGLLDPSFGPDQRSLVTYAGLILALLAVTWAAALPIRAAHRAAGDPGRWHAVGGTLLVAAACVLISRLAGFLPGYLYGLILGYRFARQLDGAGEGRARAVGAIWMLGLAAVAWFTLGAVRSLGIEGTPAATIAESVLAALVVAGIEGVVFGLLPLRFLHGEPIFRWHKWLWGLLYAVGLFGFVAVLINPSAGVLAPSTHTSFLTAVGLFVAFGLASVLFWGYFRFRPAASAS